MRRAGAVTMNGVDVLSPFAFSVNGASVGVEVQPCGSRSRSVPLTGSCDAKAGRANDQLLLVRRRAERDDEQRRVEANRYRGTTLTSRRSSPRTASA